MTIQQLLDRKNLLEERLKQLDNMLNKDGNLALCKYDGRKDHMYLTIENGGSCHRQFHLPEELEPIMAKFLGSAKVDDMEELDKINDTLATMEKVLQGLTGGVQC